MGTVWRRLGLQITKYRVHPCHIESTHILSSLSISYRVHALILSAFVVCNSCLCLYALIGEIKCIYLFIYFSNSRGIWASMMPHMLPYFRLIALECHLANGSWQQYNTWQLTAVQQVAVDSSTTRGSWQQNNTWQLTAVQHVAVDRRTTRGSWQQCNTW